MYCIYIKTILTFLCISLEKKTCVTHSVIRWLLCITWLKNGAHFPPGSVLQRSQERRRVKVDIHLKGAVKQALSPNSRMGQEIVETSIKVNK